MSNSFASVASHRYFWHMIHYVKKYYSFGIGFVILLIILLLLQLNDIIKIPYDSPLEITLVFTFWWLAISLPIYKFSYLKQNRKKVYQLLALAALFICTLVMDSNWSMPDNPLTILLLFFFWLGLFYIISPSFVKKYKHPILLVYGFSMLYFTYVRLFSGDLDFYYENEKRMAMSFLVLPVPIFILLWIYEQWKWLKTLKTDKANAELALLKTQINPHFFFNTLNNLYSLTVKQSEKAPEVILKLSEMMRYTIYEGQKEFVPLKEEVAYLNNYIELHKIRYHKSVDIRFEHEIANDASVTPLLFIILLENAFKHGVESLSDNAYIHMQLSSLEDGIYFSIENNFDEKEVGEEAGIGLENLKKRLKLVYPKTHTLSISQSDNRYKVALKIDTI
ncbi:sensor histidine kinase [Flammeovirgaceae bacterium SG7u.111]|nr:sensor histidine kinase [Flammeovirgaceae bacterium SG7u.132]WPO37829.1 sensor histidine kinase [Flammeovirgaceae bacterium SG7u.111]